MREKDGLFRWMDGWSKSKGGIEKSNWSFVTLTAEDEITKECELTQKKENTVREKEEVC